MMTAYFPDFSVIDTITISKWIYQLENQISSLKKNDEQSPNGQSKK